MRCLSKETKGKSSVGSKALDSFRGNRRCLAMDIALGDFDALDLDWLSDWRFAKAREDAQTRLREIFYRIMSHGKRCEMIWTHRTWTIGCGLYRG